MFDQLWKNILAHAGNSHFSISKVAFDEVKNTIDNKDTQQQKFIQILKKFVVIETDIDDFNFVKRAKQKLGIVEDKYGNGVGENDLLIIATAERTNATLVTNEGVQSSAPENKSNAKIPLVCKWMGGVQNINLQELINSDTLWKM